MPEGSLEKHCVPPHQLKPFFSFLYFADQEKHALHVESILKEYSNVHFSSFTEFVTILTEILKEYGKASYPMHQVYLAGKNDHLFLKSVPHLSTKFNPVEKRGVVNFLAQAAIVEANDTAIDIGQLCQRSQKFFNITLNAHEIERKVVAQIKITSRYNKRYEHVLSFLRYPELAPLCSTLLDIALSLDSPEQQKVNAIFLISFLIGSAPPLLRKDYHKTPNILSSTCSGGAFAADVALQLLFQQAGLPTVPKNFLSLTEVQLLAYFSSDDPKLWNRPYEAYLEATRQNVVNELFHPLNAPTTGLISFIDSFIPPPDLLKTKVLISAVISAQLATKENIEQLRNKIDTTFTELEQYIYLYILSSYIKLELKSDLRDIALQGICKFMNLRGLSKILNGVFTWGEVDIEKFTSAQVSEIWEAVKPELARIILAAPNIEPFFRGDTCSLSLRQKNDIWEAFKIKKVEDELSSASLYTLIGGLCSETLQLEIMTILMGRHYSFLRVHDYVRILGLLKGQLSEFRRNVLFECSSKIESISDLRELYSCPLDTLSTEERTSVWGLVDHKTLRFNAYCLYVLFKLPTELLTDAIRGDLWFSFTQTPTDICIFSLPCLIDFLKLPSSHFTGDQREHLITRFVKQDQNKLHSRGVGLEDFLNLLQQLSTKERTFIWSNYKDTIFNQFDKCRVPSYLPQFRAFSTASEREHLYFLRQFWAISTSSEKEDLWPVFKKHYFCTITSGSELYNLFMLSPELLSESQRKNLLSLHVENHFCMDSASYDFFELSLEQFSTELRQSLWLTTKKSLKGIDPHRAVLYFELSLEQFSREQRTEFFETLEEEGCLFNLRCVLDKFFTLSITQLPLSQRDYLWSKLTPESPCPEFNQIACYLLRIGLENALSPQLSLPQKLQLWKILNGCGFEEEHRDCVIEFFERTVRAPFPDKMSQIEEFIEQQLKGTLLGSILKESPSSCHRP